MNLFKKILKNKKMRIKRKAVQYRDYALE